MKFRSKSKQVAVLIDPDKNTDDELTKIISLSIENHVDLFLVGSSILMQKSVDQAVDLIKNSCSIPVYLFPGNVLQVCKKADGILLLSLISGRNAELLIGQHVIAAPSIKEANFDIIPTGYMLIESGSQTSVEYMSNTRPIPSNKTDISVCTAMAGEQLGLQSIYLEAGSGASFPVPLKIISEIKKNIKIPIWVGGGLKSPEDVVNACNAGADIVVIGSVLEENSSLIIDICNAVHQLNQ